MIIIFFVIISIIIVIIMLWTSISIQMNLITTFTSFFLFDEIW